ncbi:sulfite exporter TauE/SafE family protein [Actinomadura logoneensis]|uniref:sulfite exporter TauE/SafE family protein n=1 Tax=Actinomadura logoneensis TaxID=2293572 RepID=UPI0022A7B344|nr:sulfite exporter TauE/SafE family protein [Actinomadura logoneensis]
MPTERKARPHPGPPDQRSSPRPGTAASRADRAESATAPRPTGPTILAPRDDDTTTKDPATTTRTATAHRDGHLRTATTGAGLGAVTGLLGVGGGFLIVPTLVSVLRLPMRTAVGTSLVVILINSLVSLTTRLAVGGDSLDYTILAPFATAAVLGAWEGKHLAAKLSGTALQRAFAVLLLAVAAAMLTGVLL